MRGRTAAQPDPNVNKYDRGSRPPNMGKTDGSAPLCELRRMIDSRDRGLRRSLSTRLRHILRVQFDDDARHASRHDRNGRVLRAHVVRFLFRQPLLVRFLAFVLRRSSARVHLAPMMMVNLELAENLMPVSCGKEQRHEHEQETVIAHSSHLSGNA